MVKRAWAGVPSANRTAAPRLAACHAGTGATPEDGALAKVLPPDADGLTILGDLLEEFRDRAARR